MSIDDNHVEYDDDDDNDDNEYDVDSIDWTVIVEGYLMPGVAGVGFCLNLVSIIYFCKLKHQSTFLR